MRGKLRLWQLIEERLRGQKKEEKGEKRESSRKGDTRKELTKMFNEKYSFGTWLIVQWLIMHLPMRTQVRSLVRERRPHMPRSELSPDTVK